MRTHSLLFMLMLTMAVNSQTPDANTILDKVDENMSSQTQIMTATMEIYSARATRTMEMKIWTEGDRKSFTEYLAPAREKGTKMLKLDKQLWVYSPTTDRTIQISGHMLRQSVMGSDLSYEDMMTDKRLIDQYKAEVTGEQTIDGRECWELTLTAIVSDINYHSQKIWVDKERFVMLQAQLFAKSGKQLKEITFSKVQKIGGRWFPMSFLYRDVLKNGKGTRVNITKILFNETIPDNIFNKSNLR